MIYTKEDAKRYLYKAIEDLKNNPACDVTDEELERRYAILDNDESLQMIANLLTAMRQQYDNNYMKDQ